MSTESFLSIAAGLSFDSKRNASEQTLFKRKDEKKEKDVAPAQAGVAVGIPHIPASLDLFGESHTGSASAPATSRIEESNENAVPSMSQKKANNIRKKSQILIDGLNVPQPLTHFSELARPPLSHTVPKHIVDNLFSREHRVPTAIQMQAVPVLLEGRDVLACAPTGSGKTLAYVVPMFARLRSPNPDVGVRAVVVVPTMELAVQVEREIFLMMKGQRWKLVQHGQSTKGKDIFVTTPLRLVNMIKEKHIDVGAVEYVVFDEGDKLWDGSTDFIKMVDEIIAACTCPRKVVALFTATLTKQAETLARSVMPNDPVRIIINSRTAASRDVDQRLLFTGNELGKIIALRNLIREGFVPPVLIFVQSIERTKDLYDEINCAGLHCAIINSTMKPSDRDELVTQFRLGNIWVLITTELLARGIDFKNVGTVINYDFPASSVSYIHRIGRTGRAGRKGVAITMFTEDDKERLPMIAGVIRDAGGQVEDWMLDIKTTRTKLRHLSKETPHRMIISTKKRQFLRKKANERELKAMKRERDEARANGDIDSDDE